MKILRGDQRERFKRFLEQLQIKNTSFRKTSFWYERKITLKVYK